MIGWGRGGHSSLVGDVEVVVALLRLCQDADVLAQIRWRFLLSRRRGGHGAGGRDECTAWRRPCSCGAVGRSVPRVPAPWRGGRDDRRGVGEGDARGGPVFKALRPWRQRRALPRGPGGHKLFADLVDDALLLVQFGAQGVDPSPFLVIWRDDALCEIHGRVFLAGCSISTIG